MNQNAEISRAELQRLQERVADLAQDKSYLQLVMRLMDRISAAPGLANTIESMLQSVVEVIGATNIVLYYRIDDALFYADVFGERRSIDRIDDVLVQTVFETRQPVESEHSFQDTRMLSAEFTSAFTWVFPLAVGPELVGILKLEGLHLSTRKLCRQLPTFFHYAALILRNEILNRTRLKVAHDRLRQANAELASEIAERKRAEEEIRQLNATLEQRVAERTVALQRLNDRLQRELAERLRAEEALRQSEQRYRMIVETAEEGIWLVDRDWRTKFVNSRMASMLGWRQDDMIGRCIGEFMDEGARRHAVDLTARRERGIRETHDFRFMRRDGAALWALVSANAITDESGDAIGFLAMVTDVTSRRRAQEAIAASEERYRTLFEESFDGLFVTSPQGRLVDLNKKLVCILGYDTKEEMLALDLARDVYAHPTDRALILALVNERGAAEYEVSVKKKGGEIMTAQCALTAVRSPAGEIVAYRGILRDITERKRAEDLLRTANAYHRSLIEANLDPLATVGPDGRITDVNTATELVTGYSRQELVGTHCWDYFVDPIQARLGYEQVFRDGQLRDYALDMRHRDGRVTSVLYNASVYRNEAGEAVGMLAAARDISELRKAEELYHRLQLQLTHMGRLATMGELLAGISHEVNQPLYAIENFAKACGNLLAMNEPRLDDLREWNREIAAEAARGGEIIRRMRRFLGGNEGQRGPVRVREVIEESLSLVAFEIRRLGLAVCRQFADEDPIANADRIQVQQVLVNLLQNACEALEGNALGDRQLTLFSEVTGESVHTCVADNGPGLSGLEASQVFEPFVTTKTQGLGMGLAISRTIVAAHGGRIWLTANSDRGAAFHFTLPLAQAVRDDGD